MVGRLACAWTSRAKGSRLPTATAANSKDRFSMGGFLKDSKEAADYRQSAAISLPIIRSRKCDAAMPNRVRAAPAPLGRPRRLEQAKPQLTAAAASPVQ